MSFRSIKTQLDSGRFPLVLFFAMGCLGVTTEIFFTAISEAFLSAGPIDWKLTGRSYVWMFPIYGSIAFTFPPLLKRWARWPSWRRALVFGVGILAVEYLSGWALCSLTGACPWEYRTGIHIQGWVRLDYYPLWVIFAALVERVVTYLEPRLR